MSPDGRDTLSTIDGGQINLAETKIMPDDSTITPIRTKTGVLTGFVLTPPANTHEGN